MKAGNECWCGGAVLNAYSKSVFLTLINTGSTFGSYQPNVISQVFRIHSTGVTVRSILTLINSQSRLGQSRSLSPWARNFAGGVRQH